MAEMINLYIEKTERKTKPSVYETKGIAASILKHEALLTIEDIAEQMATEGKTAVLATYKKRPTTPRKSNLIKSQQLFALDFDNKEYENAFLLNEALDHPFIIENAAFVYKTFSDKTSKQDRFRVIFVLDEPIYDNEDSDHIYAILKDKFPQADTSTLMHSKLVFGSDEGYMEVDFENRLQLDEMLETPIISEPDNKKSPFAVPVQKSQEDTQPSEIVNTESITGYSQVWQMIKTKKYGVAKQTLGDTYAKGFKSKQALINYFSQEINMAEFLGLPMGEPFQDIFHYDNNPSANIFRTERGTTLYKCFSDTAPFTGNLIHVVQRLTGNSYTATIDLLLDLSGSRMVTTGELKKAEETLDTLIGNLALLDFKVLYPSLDKVIGTMAGEVIAILEIIKNNLYEDEKTGEIRFLTYITTDNLARMVASRTGKAVNAKKVGRTVNVMALLDMVTKLTDEDLPEKLNKELKRARIDKQYKRRSDAMEFIATDKEDFINSLNENAALLVEKRFTQRAMSTEWIIRNLSINDAIRVYPQEKERLLSEGISDNSMEMEQVSLAFIFSKISKQQYVFESDVEKHLKKNFDSMIVDTKWVIMRDSLSESYGLTRTRFTKAIKEELGKEKVKSSAMVFIAD